MAKIVYACVRDAANAHLIKKRIDSIIHKLVPDNIPDARCKVVDNGNIIYGISTYTEAIMETTDSVCMGVAYSGAEKWWQPLNGHPEGTYAIFRADENYVEAVTDIACTRAVWYYKDEEIFIAGTSQRAVIAVAGKFDFERRNIPWMLSAGSLGPSLSWCKNLHFADPYTTVLLNRKTWGLTIKSLKASFVPSALPAKEFQEQFKKTLLGSFSAIDIDLSKWALPMSGGYDSRGIACLLRDTERDISRLNTITWGTQSSAQNKNSDGYLGGAVAKALGMQHKFWPTDDMKEPIEKIFDRFIHCSEGRIDHITGYTDGMIIWKNIFDSGKHGILRGDEAFGAPHCNTFLRSRLWSEFKLCADFSNLENFEQQYGYEKQVIPEQLKENPGKETPGTYRERFYQGFRMPVMLSALSDIKYAYTEILNPFLSKKIMLQARTIPDAGRKERALYIKTIREISPAIPYATEKATGSREQILNTPEAVKILTAEISADYMKELFSEEFLSKVITKLKRPVAIVHSNYKSKIKAFFSRNVPIAIKEKFRKSMPKPALDNGILAFRIYIIGKIYKMFTADFKQIN